MIDAKYIELINREIDGANSDKEGAKLREHLAKNPEAQQLYEELATVSNVLKKVTIIEPSPNLRKTILNSLPSGKYAAREKRKLFIPQMGALFGVYKLRYAYALVAGIVIGSVAYSIFDAQRSTPSDFSTLYGTMLSHQYALSFETAYYEQVILDELDGTLEIKYAEGVVVAELDLQSQQETEIVLEFDENDLGFLGFGQFQGSKFSVSVDKNNVRLRNMGENRAVFMFTDKTRSISPLNVKIFAAGALVYEKSGPTGRNED